MHLRARTNGVTVSLGENNGVEITRQGGRLIINLSAVDAASISIIGGPNADKIKLVDAPNGGMLSSDVIVPPIDWGSLQIGDTLPDGWIFAGKSPVTNGLILLEPFESAPREPVTWKEARSIAKEIGARLPHDAYKDSNSELHHIFNSFVAADRNTNAKLDTRSGGPHGRIWSSEPNDASTAILVRYMDDGRLSSMDPVDSFCRVRCVRDVSPTSASPSPRR